MKGQNTELKIWNFEKIQNAANHDFGVGSK